MIFYVEDDTNIRELTLYALEKANHEALGFADAQAFFEACENTTPDCILLDIMLPGKSGLEILSEIRTDVRLKDIPVMMLTAKGTELDRVVGLDSGADDYLPKPFGMMELISRVNALLRRASQSEKSESSENILKLGCISIDKDRRTVTIADKPCILTMKEFDLLALFAQNKERVLSREQIMRDVWETEFMGTTRTVDVHVLSLRQKLEAVDSSAKNYISTVRGVGYKATSRVEGAR